MDQIDSPAFKSFEEQLTQASRFAIRTFDLQSLTADWKRFQADLVVDDRLKDMAQGAALSVERTLDRLGGLGRLQQVNDALAKIIQPTDIAMIKPMQAFLGAEWPRLQTYVTELEKAAREASDEPTRQSRLADHIKGLIEAALGIDMTLDVPYKRLALRYGLIFILINVLFWLRNWHYAAKQDANIRELLRIEREQAETLAAVTETIRQLQSSAPESVRAPSVYLRVTNHGSLRDGPSGAAHRVRRVKPGQTLRLVMPFERWYYVEMINKDDHDPPVVGWIYRRSVTIVPNRPDQVPRKMD
jgi:hypothetical protein